LNTILQRLTTHWQLRTPHVVVVPTHTANGQRGSRARRAIAFAVFAFLIVQLAFGTVVQREWLPLRDPLFHEKFERLQKHTVLWNDDKTTLRILAIGSSRLHLSFDAKRVSEKLSTAYGRPAIAYNFGTSGAGPLTNSLYLKRLIDAGVRADCVVLELHPALIGTGEGGFLLEGRWLHGYRLRPGECEQLAGYSFAPEYPPSFGVKAYLTATHAYRMPALNRYATVWLPCPFGLTLGAQHDAFGFVPGIELPLHERPTAFQRTLAQYRDVFTGYRVGGPGAAALRDSLAICQATGLRAALLVTPESPEFQRQYGPDGARQIAAFIDELRREFSITILNARDAIPDGELADGHHPTPAGGAIFTDWFAMEFQRTWQPNEGTR